MEKEIIIARTVYKGEVDDEVCESMYQAHTIKIWSEANGIECKILMNGKEITNLPEDVIHPNNYNQFK